MHTNFVEAISAHRILINEAYPEEIPRQQISTAGWNKNPSVTAVV